MLTDVIEISPQYKLNPIFISFHREFRFGTSPSLQFTLDLDMSINSLSQREHQPDVTEIGTMVTEFDKLQKLNKQMIDDAARVEKEFYTICQKFHAEKTEWKNEQIR